MIIITNTTPFADAKAFAAAVDIARKANRGRWICFHGVIRHRILRDGVPLDISVKSFDLWPQLICGGHVRRGCEQGIKTVTGFKVAIASAITEIQLSLEAEESRIALEHNAKDSNVLGRKENNSVILPGV